MFTKRLFRRIPAVSILKTSFDVIQNNWYGVRIFAVLKQYLQNNYSNARLITTGAFVVIMLM